MTRRSLRVRPTGLLVVSIVCLLVGMVDVSRGGSIAIVVPNAYANAEAPYWAETELLSDLRCQLIYAADQFGDLPALGGYLTSFRWRPDSATPSPADLSINELTWRASVTYVAPDNMSLCFDYNITGPVTVVRAPAPWQGHTDNEGSAGGPKEFDIEFVLDTPYHYIPAEGNLLLDCTVYGLVSPVAFDRLADGERSQAALIVRGDPADPCAFATAYVGSIVTEFTFIPIYLPGDLDGDDNVDWADLVIFEACATGPGIAYDPANLPAGCTLPTDDAPDFIPADFDRDHDVDQADFAIFQRCYSSEGNPVDWDCAD
jgi:hypothetical protein